MKNIKKLLLIITIVLTMCMFLGGCTQLDDMREQHAVWTVAGEDDSITYKGVEYKKLPPPEYPNEYFFGYSNTIYVTDPDVPVLLSGSYGEALDISKDDIYIYGYLFDNEYEYISSGHDVYYCKAELYDEITAKAEEKIEYTKYAYLYYDDMTDFSEIKAYYLTDKEMETVDKIVSEEKPLENSDIYNNGYYLVDLQKFSDDGYFCKASYEIYGDDKGNYYLVDYTYSLDEYSVYSVPKEMYSTFDNITKHADSMDAIAFRDMR